MVSGVRVRSDTRALNNAIRGLPRFAARMQSVNKQGADEMRRRALPQLQAVPPRHDFPYGQFPWTTDKQRKFVLGYVLDRDGAGNIIQYQRTGALPKAWEVNEYRRGDIYGFTTRNTAPAAPYVYGTVNLLNRAEAIKPQQRFHRLIGWPIAVDILKPEVDHVRRLLFDLVFEEFEDTTGLKVTRRSL